MSVGRPAIVWRPPVERGGTGQSSNRWRDAAVMMRGRLAKSQEGQGHEDEDAFAVGFGAGVEGEESGHR